MTVSKLAQQWGVAMATATKALTVLRNDGVVLARPRSGTVVAPDTVRQRASPGGVEPTHARIVDAAMRIADVDGLAAVSMRMVAARLGVATMTIYRHVRDKEDLLVQMSEAAYGEQPPAEEQPVGWRSRVELASRRLWEIHKRHPWLTQITPLTRPLPLHNQLAYSEMVLSALAECGVDPVAAFDLDVLLYSHVIGTAAHLEGEARAAAATGVSDEQWITGQMPALEALVATGRFPSFAATLTEMDRRGGYDLDLDRLFELGLRLLLDGVAAMVEPSQ
ncbi:MAG: TetR/AcrR family transcriptional regulator C-terminal domain-containing protein [Streptosporangiales bacterium]